MEPTLDLTIVIPNYNTRDLLRQCLHSIYDHTDGISFEIICIDENSPDGSADMVAQEFPDVRLVRNTSPKFYAANNNIGIKMSLARYACLLNSDTMLKSNAFKNLVEFMDSHPEAAACGPKLLNPDGSTQHCIRRFVGIPTMFLQAINWHKIFPKSRLINQYYFTDFDYSREQHVESIGTTAYVVRRSTWEQAGLLDERFRLAVVDLAYNLMLKRKGFQVYYTPCAEVVHFGSQSINQQALNSLKDLHKALADFADYYDYFGSAKILKLFTRVALTIRYYIKLGEYYFGMDKRVIKGPGAPAFKSSK
jgi:GT2 family glycosyltransferase